MSTINIITAALNTLAEVRFSCCGYKVQCEMRIFFLPCDRLIRLTNKLARDLIAKGKMSPVDSLISTLQNPIKEYCDDKIEFFLTRITVSVSIIPYALPKLP